MQAYSNYPMRYASELSGMELSFMLNADLATSPSPQPLFPDQHLLLTPRVLPHTHAASPTSCAESESRSADLTRAGAGTQGSPGVVATRACPASARHR
jgi:hypothetical protein